MTEYGRIHTDGSRSGGQPAQADIDAMESILWVDTIIDDKEAIAKVFARHRQYGYDQGYYDGQRDRQPTQDDALREENERLREHLISALDTLKDAEVCDDNCGPCNEARAALGQSK